MKQISKNRRQISMKNKFKNSPSELMSNHCVPWGYFLIRWSLVMEMNGTLTLVQQGSTWLGCYSFSVWIWIFYPPGLDWIQHCANLQQQLSCHLTWKLHLHERSRYSQTPPGVLVLCKPENRNKYLY